MESILTMKCLDNDIQRLFAANLKSPVCMEDNMREAGFVQLNSFFSKEGLVFKSTCNRREL